MRRTQKQHWFISSRGHLPLVCLFHLCRSDGMEMQMATQVLSCMQSWFETVYFTSQMHKWTRHVSATRCSILQMEILTKNLIVLTKNSSTSCQWSKQDRGRTRTSSTLWASADLKRRPSGLTGWKNVGVIGVCVFTVFANYQKYSCILFSFDCFDSLTKAIPLAPPYMLWQHMQNVGRQL